MITYIVDFVITIRRWATQQKHSFGNYTKADQEGKQLSGIILNSEFQCGHMQGRGCLNRHPISSFDIERLYLVR